MLECLGRHPLKKVSMNEWCERKDMNIKWITVCCGFSAICWRKQLIYSLSLLMRERGVVTSKSVIHNCWFFCAGDLCWTECRLVPAFGSQTEFCSENGQRGVSSVHTWALPSHAEPPGLHLFPRPSSGLSQQQSNEVGTIMVTIANTGLMEFR